MIISLEMAASNQQPHLYTQSKIHFVVFTLLFNVGCRTLGSIALDVALDLLIHCHRTDQPVRVRLGTRLAGRPFMTIVFRPHRNLRRWIHGSLGSRSFPVQGHASPGP